MSGWDTSRPTWDPEDEPGDTTQAFSPKDYSESDQPGQRPPRHGSNGPSYEPGRAGPPPDIFQPGYDQPGYDQPGYDQPGYDRDRNGQGSHHSPRAAEQDHARRGPASGYPPVDRDRDYTARDDYATRDYAPRDYVGRDPAPEPDALRDPALQDFFAPRERRPNPAEPDDAGQWYGTRGQPGVGQGDQPSRSSGGGFDPLSDPFPPEPGPPAQPGQLGRSARPFGTERPERPEGRPFGAERPDPTASQPRPPFGDPPPPARPPGQFNHPKEQPARRDWRSITGPINLTGPLARLRDRPSVWDPPGGARSQRERRRVTPRERMMVAVGIALLIVIGLGLYLVGKGNSSDTGGGGNQALPLPSTTASKAAPTSSSTAGVAKKKPPVKTAAGFTLTTAATAGGYPLMSAIPAYVQGPASTTAQAIRNAAVSDGAKITGKVSGAYQLRLGQVMAFTGYEGTFNPAKVIASLATLGSNGATYSPGKDGGKLACAVAPGTQPGTVCVWVTTTSLGITEFFSSTGPENVSDQAKTAADTRNFRAGVEHRK
jgi:hypothetical protein